MITGTRRQFEACYRQRGYTLDEVRPCIVSEDGDTVTVDETHPRYPRPKPGDGPSLLQKTRNFATSAAAHVAAGMPRASQEEIERRFSLCKSCDRFDGRACTLCGCPIKRESKMISKLAWANESCPIGKWGPVGNSQQEPVRE